MPTPKEELDRKQKHQRREDGEIILSGFAGRTYGHREGDTLTLTFTGGEEGLELVEMSAATLSEYQQAVSRLEETAAENAGVATELAETAEVTQLEKNRTSSVRQTIEAMDADLAEIDKHLADCDEALEAARTAAANTSDRLYATHVGVAATQVTVKCDSNIRWRVDSMQFDAGLTADRLTPADVVAVDERLARADQALEHSSVNVDEAIQLTDAARAAQPTT